MRLKKFFGLERRQAPRYDVAIDVEFLVWDERSQRPLTEKYTAGLTNLSLTGACLQTNHILIGGHHLMIHNDVDGKTPLVIHIPLSSSGDPSLRKIKAQVLWYKKGGGERRFQFDVGLKFISLSEEDRQSLNSLIRISAD